MSRYAFDTTQSASSLLELELGDAHTPSVEKYWTAPLIRTVISPYPIDESSNNPARVASRDSHRIGA